VSQAVSLNKSFPPEGGSFGTWGRCKAYLSRNGKREKAMKGAISFLFSGVTFFSLCSSPVSALAAKPVRLVAAGSGVNLAITQLLAQSFSVIQPGIVIDVPGSIGSRGAIQATSDDAIPIGLISRQLKENERNLGLIEVPYARVAIVVGANKLVSDDDISSQELIDVFRGEKTTWRDGRGIVVQARERSDSGFLVLEKKIPGFHEAYEQSHQQKRWMLYFTDQDANQALSRTPYAIGVCDLGMIATEHLDIKVLKLDGITPSAKSVTSGQYPLSRELSFIYKKGKLSPQMQQFFDYVPSKDGAQILASYGYAPVASP